MHASLLHYDKMKNLLLHVVHKFCTTEICFKCPLINIIGKVVKNVKNVPFHF